MSIPDFIEFIHQGQTRKTGDKYTSHLYAVRHILEMEGITESTILDAALLHDVLEESQITKEYLGLKFGNKVAVIVDLLSKSDSWNTAYCKMKSNLDEIEGSWIEHPEAVLIKMADRLHNLQTIHGFSNEKQREYLQETDLFLIPLFKKILQRNHLGDLKKYIENLLQKLLRETRLIRLSINHGN